MNIKIPPAFFVAVVLAGIAFLSIHAFQPEGAIAFLAKHTASFNPFAAVSSVVVSDQSSQGEPDVKIRYARPRGDDANDGLTWKTAKETIRAAIESLPDGGGTVYFADNTYSQQDKTKGLWIMGVSDPNYANPPAGWIRIGGKGLHLVGAAGDNSSLGQMYDQQAKILGGSPVLWVSGIPGTGLNIDNLLAMGSQPARLGIDSNGKRDVAAFGAVGVKIRRSGFVTLPYTPDTAGPAMDIGGMSFWVWLEDDSFGVTSNAPLNSARHAAINVDGGAVGHVGLLTIRDSIFHDGGLRYVASADTWGFTIENVVEEGDFVHAVPPAVQIIGGNQYGQAVISGVSVADAPGTEATIKVDPSIPSDAVLVYNSSDVTGPATIMNMYPAGRGQNSNPSGQNQVGFWQGRVWAVQDSARRSFAPAAVRFINLASTNPAAWNISGSITKTVGVAAPDGTRGAARCNAADEGGYLIPYSSNRKYSVGDWVIIGVWARANSANGFGNISSGSGMTVSANGPAEARFNNGTWYVAASPIQRGDGEWQWVYAAGKVISTSGRGNATAGLNCSPNNPSIDYYAPVFLHIPAGTISDSEAAEIARHLSAVPSDRDATPGTVSVNEFQKFLAWEAKFKGDVNIDGTLQVGKGGIKFPDGSVLTSASQLTKSAPAATSIPIPLSTPLSMPTSTPTSVPTSISTSSSISTAGSLVAQYKLNESFGSTVADSSGNNLNGAVMGTPAWVPGVLGNALGFDGSDYISVPDSPLLRLANDMTISAWVYRDPATSSNDWVRIAGKGDSNNRNYGLWYYGYTGEILFQIYGDLGYEQAGTNWGTVVNKLTLDPGKWYLVTGVRQGDTASLYLNGTLVSSHTFALTPSTSADPFTIGYAGYSNKHIGKIDEVRVYNRALSQGEVQGMYAAAYGGGTGKDRIDVASLFMAGVASMLDSFSGFAESFFWGIMHLFP